jgi:hypothetical protein
MFSADVTRRWKDELEHRAKSDPAKLAIAARLRRKTTLTIREIAKLLYMGKAESLNSKLHHWRKAHEPASHEKYKTMV